jgi:hypothetical protein
MYSFPSSCYIVQLKPLDIIVYKINIRRLKIGVRKEGRLVEDLGTGMTQWQDPVFVYLFAFLRNPDLKLKKLICYGHGGERDTCFPLPF